MQEKYLKAYGKPSPCYVKPNHESVVRYSELYTHKILVHNHPDEDDGVGICTPSDGDLGYAK